MEAADRARNRAPAIAVLCSVQFIDVLGVTVVVTALPRMLTDLGAPAADGSLVSGGYAMFFGGLLMLGARLGDRFGHRRTIIASLAVSALGALLGAVAGSVVLLTAARCLQGAAAAGSVPSALRLLTSFPADGLRRPLPPAQPARRSPPGRPPPLSPRAAHSLSASWPRAGVTSRLCGLSFARCPSCAVSFCAGPVRRGVVDTRKDRRRR